jgi:tRNA(Ile)-lysidine synthase
MAEFLPFEARLAKRWPPARWNEVTTLVGLSGGADSVALLRALCRIQGGMSGQIVAAHFNHHWRGEESDGDAQFCRELAVNLGLEIFVGDASTSPKKSATSEEGARSERYAFFRQAAERVAARYLVLAHHRDDQVETVLQRIIRGTSLRGLSGMRRLRPLSEMTTIVRPLLCCPRIAIEKYLAALKQPYRTDSTNANPAWLRNRIRAELIPLLESKYAHQASRSIARLAAESAETTAYLDGLAQAALDEAAKLNPSTGSATLNNVDDLSPFLLRQVLVQVWQCMNWPVDAMTRKHWRKMAEDLQSKKNGSLGQYPGAIHVSREGEWVYFNRPNQV